MKKIKYGAIGILIIAIFSLSVISMNMKEVEIATNANTVSNKKIGWGIKRNNNLSTNVLQIGQKLKI